MCGICGIIDFSGRPVSRDEVSAMCAELKHRGPDDEGVYLNSAAEYGGGPSAGLGHRRLSIIDLSPSGHQPMSNEDATLWMVFNGEVYNFRELRTALEEGGHRFKSNSDSEAFLHAYEEYGEECLGHIRGMFAFAIWDEKKNRLFAGRDRLGKKPFLYYFDKGRFCFASEFSSLLKSGFVPREIDRQAIHNYLTLGYVPAPSAVFKGVRKLMPAHCLVADKNGIATRPYWRLDYSRKIAISEEDAAEELIRQLKEAVRIRLYSDVPLGAFLSGGIDSSTVVALMSMLSDSKVKTFSIGFEEEDYNELKYARVIADRFDTDHKELIVRPKALDILPMLVEHYGEPYADSSCIPTYYVSQQTRAFVTVALNGDGGDESFAGYERYQAMAIAESLRRLPGAAFISRLGSLLPDSTDPRDTLRRIRRFFSAAELPAAERYLRWISVAGDLDIKGLYSEDFLRGIETDAPLKMFKAYFADNDGLNALDRLLRIDVETNLPNDLLVKADIASMAASLEARAPFLDHKVMEFAASLPPKLKMRRLVKKYLLKKAMSGIIPDETLSRRKMGFGMPVGKWFAGELKDYLRDNLLSKKSLSRGYFKPQEITKITEKHISNTKDYSFQLWALLMLELWHQKFMDTNR